MVHTNAHLCGTYTATNAPADTTGTALGSACSSQVLQTVALMSFRDRLTAGQAAVSTWNMSSGNPVREARPRFELARVFETFAGVGCRVLALRIGVYLWWVSTMLGRVCWCLNTPARHTALSLPKL